MILTPSICEKFPENQHVSGTDDPKSGLAVFDRPSTWTLGVVVREKCADRMREVYHLRTQNQIQKAHKLRKKKEL